MNALGLDTKTAISLFAVAKAKLEQPQQETKP